MPIARRRTDAGQLALAERIAWYREQDRAARPPWGDVGIVGADGPALKVIVAEAYLGAIRAGATPEQALSQATIAGRAWAEGLARSAATDEAACAHSLYQGATAERPADLPRMVPPPHTVRS